MVGQSSSSSSPWSSSSSSSSSAHLSQEYNSLLSTGYPTTHPATAQAPFQGEQNKYLGLTATEAKYGLMSETKYGMADSGGLETKYSSHLASQGQGSQVKVSTPHISNFQPFKISNFDCFRMRSSSSST